MARKALREPRDFDDNIPDDWLGPFFQRAFGKTEFGMGEIMDGGRDFRTQWIELMTIYFEYQWDQEIGKRREIQPDRLSAEVLATEYVDGIYDLMLDMFASGENLYEHSIEFDASLHRVRDVRGR